MSTENQEFEVVTDPAAEAAAFEASFNEQRGEPVEVTPAPAVAEENPTPVVEESPATPVEETPASPPVLIAGLTEEQVKTALARNATLQSTVDKLGGRLGSLMQQVEQLKSAPKSQADRMVFDAKLEKLGAAFPELAELLREDLKSVAAAPVETAAPAAPAFTQEDVDRILSEKLQVFQQQQEVAMETRALGAVHPDWQDVIRTSNFALWRDNVIQDGAELMQSENAAYISRKLTEFKDWVKATSVPTPQPVVPPVPNKRLANAVLPQGTPSSASAPVTEEDAFLAGFTSSRAQRQF